MASYNDKVYSIYIWDNQVLLGTCWGPIGNFKWRIECWEHVEDPLGTSSGGSDVGNMLRTPWELVDDPMLGTCWGPIGNLWRIHVGNMLKTQYWELVEDPMLGTCWGSIGNLWKIHVGNMLRTQYWKLVEGPILGTCWGPIGNLTRTQWKHIDKAKMIMNISRSWGGDGSHA
jgi:hypothetical protein